MGRDKNLAAILAAYFAEFHPFLEQCGIPFTLDQFCQEYQDRKVEQSLENAKLVQENPQMTTFRNIF
jgi:hypothetical protein